MLFLDPELRMIEEKKMVGHHMRMSLPHNKTGLLWQGFMPKRGLINHPIGSELYSIQVYETDLRPDELLTAEFEKWAAVEVTEFDEIPEGMETLVLPPGLYAVFMHYGPASQGENTFGYIFGTWLPASGYELDNRPHFEVLGEKYKNNAADSEEEVWIPVRRK